MNGPKRTVGAIALALVILAPAVAGAEGVPLSITSTTDGQVRDFTVVHEESHPDYPACTAAAAHYIDLLVTKHGYEQLGVRKVRTPFGKRPGYQYIEISCGGGLKALGEPVRKLTEQYRQLGDAMRRATPPAAR